MDTERVAIIDENLARQYWPNEDPLGKRIQSRGDNAPWYTIVGVVGHVAHSDLANDSREGRLLLHAVSGAFLHADDCGQGVQRLPLLSPD